MKTLVRSRSLLILLILNCIFLPTNTKASQYGCECQDYYYCDMSGQKNKQSYFTYSNSTCVRDGGTEQLVGLGFTYNCPKFLQQCGGCSMFKTVSSPPNDPGGYYRCTTETWKMISLLGAAFLLVIVIILICLVPIRFLTFRESRVEKTMKSIYEEQQAKTLPMAIFDGDEDEDKVNSLILCSPDYDENLGFGNNKKTKKTSKPKKSRWGWLFLPRKSGRKYGGKNVNDPDIFSEASSDTDCSFDDTCVETNVDEHDKL